jgi:hypothetical protein
MYLQYVGVFPFPHSLNNDPRAVRLRLARGHRLWRLIPGSMARSLQKGSADCGRIYKSAARVSTDDD